MSLQGTDHANGARPLAQVVIRQYKAIGKMKLLQVLLVLSLLALAACGGSSSTDTSELLTTEFEIADKFGQSGAQVDNTFVVGDDVVFTAVINNNSAEHRTVEFTAPLITFQIFSEDNTMLIYDPDFGLVFPGVITETVIEPFGETGRKLAWRGVDNAGAQVAPGIYQVVMTIKGVNGADSVVHRTSIQLI